ELKHLQKAPYRCCHSPVPKEEDGRKSSTECEGFEDSFELYQGEYSEHGSCVQRSDSEVYNNIELENLRAGDINRWLSANIKNETVQEDIMDMTLDQRVKKHVAAAAIFTGTFVLPCFIAAKLLK
ncbi:Hypothetical predicted protein, partial [Paramuricea clavata]